MRFEVLGPLQVRTDEEAPVTIREPKVRALLADLLTHHGRPVPTDRLLHDLWGEQLPRNPANSLQTKVSQLRRMLEQAEPGGRDLVVHRPAGYLLQVADEALDAGRFADLTARARRTGNPREQVSLLSDALALWRGPAFAEFRDEPFARASATKLDEQRLTTVEELAGVRLELGEHRQLADELAELVRLHPLRDGLRSLHMRALYRSGRQTEALESYHRLAERLSEELGLDPSRELATLHQAILRQDPSLASTGPPATPAQAPATCSSADSTTIPPRTNLPAAGLTDLIGRRQDVTRVRALLTSGRLVTLTGPGGVGKTRLALEAAALAADTFPDGVWLVELDPEPADPDGVATTAHAVADTVADVLGIRDRPGDAHAGRTAERLARALGTRSLLLVLDNCEHLVQPVAELAGHLLRHAPGLRILATSQEPLALPGEMLHVVEPLPESDAVRLFAARAAAASPGFALGPANADAVARLCERLDGIPLALELAAARVRALGVHEMTERLDDRFRLLNSGLRGAPPRQRTLRAVIDWSWGLLTEPERAVLRRLAVFAGGCTLSAAEEVCAAPDVPAGTVLDVVTRLVDRSLVTVLHGQDGPRYRTLESVAAYSLERLDEAGETRLVRRRHLDHYTELAERAEPLLYGPDQRHWLHRLDTDRANLRCALTQAATGADDTADLAVRLVNSLSWYWFLRGRLGEARHSLALALSSPGLATSGARSSALARQAAFAQLAGARKENEEDEGKYGEADARARWFLAFARCGFGAAPGERDRTAGLLAEFRAQDDRWGMAATQSTRATEALYRGDLATLRNDAGDSAARFARIGDRWGQLQAAEQLGVLAEISGDYQEAARLHRDGVRVAEELQLWTDVSFRLSRLGRIALLTGDFTSAAELHERARRLAAEQGHRPAEQFAQTGLALGARRTGQFETAECHLQPWLEWNRRQGVASGEALILAELGFVAEQCGDAGRALALHLEGLDAARRAGDPRALALALEGTAGALALAGCPTDAARLLGSAAAARESVGAPLPAAERDDVDRATVRAGEVLGGEAFATAFRQGRRHGSYDVPLPDGRLMTVQRDPDGEAGSVPRIFLQRDSSSG
ncbi:BTAD domain-containing putative transcriptional regulator [Streptomyces sp. CB00455]|uniref:BTAD domain-containing putative transcriptional regulator n=1 Tax=Streptomyces sp. CB00455 TaxID=1703927 RepID=UPI00093C4ABA|nr:BTAD domain-containing putative transcriptional regulator [Streptomyces sp. CB00455]